MAASRHRVHEEDGDSARRPAEGATPPHTETKPSPWSGEAFLEEVFAAIQEGISVLDKDLNIVRANPTMQRVFAQQMPLVGKKCYAVYRDQTEPCPGCPTAKTTQDKTPRRFEVDATGPGGSPVHMEVRVYPLLGENGEVAGAVEVVRDVTERRRVEEELRASQRMLSLIIDSIPQSVFWKDIDSAYLGCNEVFARAAGITASEDIVGKTDYDLPWPKDEADAYRADDRQVMHTNRPKRHIVEPLQQADGTRLWVDTTKVPLLDGQANVIGVLGVYDDITERKRKDEALRESETKFREVFENATDAIYLVEIAGDGLPARFIDANDAACRMLGYSRDELLTMLLADTVDRGQVSSHPEIARQFAERGQAAFESTHVRQDGTRVQVDLNIRAVEIGGSRVALAIGRDVTERRRVEEAVRESEMKFREVFESANDAIFLAEMTPDCVPMRFVDVNDAACRMLGYTKQELLGLSVADITDPADRDCMPAVDKSLRETGQAAFEIGHITNKGDRIDCEVRIRIIDIKGRKTALAIARDATERKRSEEELSRYAADLARSNADLEQFAYVASHDLQEPLRMVSSYVQLLAREYQGKLGGDADEYIRYAVDGAARMRQLINDLLSFSRVGTRAKEFARVECESVFQKAVANLAQTISESGAEVTRDPLPVVVGDDVQLVQLLQNLIGNAVKFRRDEPPRVHVSAEREADGWRFSVRDNGIGIAPEHTERVFRMFERLHTAKTRPGTGIGLAICRRIVERRGGRIWVESQVGEGSTFRFTIPDGVP